jgi:hypothetical protein
LDRLSNLVRLVSRRLPLDAVFCHQDVVQITKRPKAIDERNRLVWRSDPRECYADTWTRLTEPVSAD